MTEGRSKSNEGTKAEYWARFQRKRPGYGNIDMEAAEERLERAESLGDIRELYFSLYRCGADAKEKAELVREMALMGDRKRLIHFISLIVGGFSKRAKYLSDAEKQARDVAVVAHEVLRTVEYDDDDLKKIF